MTEERRNIWVLGVDPGETTGLARVEFDLLAGEARLRYDAAMPWAEASLVVRRQLEAHANECAAERYLVNAKSASKGQEPIEAAIGMIGVCRHYCEVYSVPLTLESASAAKRLVDDDALKALGLWTTNRHSRDAVRQTVLMAVKRRWLRGSALL